MTVLCRWRGRSDYEPVWREMQDFTAARGPDTPDEIWFLEHRPVFTLGVSGRAEHLLAPGDIPVVRIDRGGQVTYHGPGQLVVYPLLDLRRLRLGVRDLVIALEESVMALAEQYGIAAAGSRAAPGVYVGARKLASVGLRIRRGCSFHGLSLNVAMDLAPFQRINPCGYAGLEMTQLADLGVTASVRGVAAELAPLLCERLGLPWDRNWSGPRADLSQSE
ncbi:MAG: lipoyl(octanoyl) transferase LipB [Gammaproteobacteria bacterium]|nr:lipoyl(octanoyl) transferase LipB [Gammaproteobacteria bacterium]